MELNQTTTKADEEALAKWSEQFRDKHANLQCPHHNEHDDFYEITDLHPDGSGSFSYHVTACCPAFEMIVKPMVSEERLWNPPLLTGHVKQAAAPPLDLSKEASTDSAAAPSTVSAYTVIAEPENSEESTHSIMVDLRSAHDLTHPYRTITLPSTFAEFISHGQKPRLYIDGHHQREYYPAFFNGSQRLSLIIDTDHH